MPNKTQKVVSIVSCSTGGCKYPVAEIAVYEPKKRKRDGVWVYKKGHRFRRTSYNMRRGVSKVMLQEAREYAEANGYLLNWDVCQGTRVPSQSAMEDLVDEAILAGVGK